MVQAFVGQAWALINHRDIYYAKCYGRGGGGRVAGEKNKNEESGERKTEENYIKNGENRLKMHLVWL